MKLAPTNHINKIRRKIEALEKRATKLVFGTGAYKKVLQDIELAKKQNPRFLWISAPKLPQLVQDPDSEFGVSSTDNGLKPEPYKPSAPLNYNLKCAGHRGNGVLVLNEQTDAFLAKWYRWEES